VAGAASICCEDVDGPRIKSGHDYFELHKNRCAFGSASMANFPDRLRATAMVAGSDPVVLTIAFS